MAQPPGYRSAENPRESCKTCAYFASGNWCEMFSVVVKPEKTCDKWTATRSEKVPMSEQRATLTAKARENLPDSAFALSGRRYPIHDISHARNALARVAQNGNAEEQAKVRAAVYRRYPSLKPSSDGRSEQLALENRDPDPDGDMDSAKDIEGEGDLDDGYTGESCNTCNGTGETDFGMCQDCQGTGIPKGEGLMAGQQSFNSLPMRLKDSLEHRHSHDFEIRNTSDGGLRFEGYASVTETPYSVGGFEETFARGAFKRTLSEQPDVSLLVNHAGLPLARTRSGTLHLSEDARGLKVIADLDPNDPDVQSIAPKMKRGDLTEMSFAFRATDDEWSERDTKRLVRSATIHRGDVSIVTVGANSSATAGIRAMVEDFEQRAGKRNSHADREEIKAAIAKLQQLLTPEDEAAEEQAQEAQEGALKISIMRSELDLARARRTRRRVHA